MRIIAACSSYWNTPEEWEARYSGVRLWEKDPLTGNVQHTLNPAYNGRFGLRNWRDQMVRLFHPDDLLITCGTWSPPEFCSMPDVTVINAGVRPDRPHSNGWQYFGCALTALMAHLCNKPIGSWDLLAFIEPDYLLGAVDWNTLLREFVQRPEEVMGAMWFDRHSDFICWKPAGAVRYLHQRLRPNLSEDESLMLPEDELHQMFKGRAWNPWKNVRSTRQDFFHSESHWEGCPTDAEVMTWPMVRMPDPAIIEPYEREQSALATPVRRD